MPLTISRRTGTSGIRELAPGAVAAIHVDDVTPRNPYAGGYGRAIPTRYRLTLSDGRTRRVYVVQYGNSGSAYVNVAEDGITAWAFLDIDTEHALQDADHSTNGAS
ncbi:hypothetical protein SEA_ALUMINUMJESUS_96 [Microbacterium phage AluminumJesus]|nr:hypothetical protein SEA_ALUMINUMJESUS_96 [Microbacterium phage AluminumJesus]UVG34467.1 hypothetical protein SEA_GAZEBO_98 [Microbacterium phage Gazebo]